MNVAAEPIVTWSAYGVLLERSGDRGAPGAPQGVYACARRRAVGRAVDHRRRRVARRWSRCSATRRGRAIPRSRRARVVARDTTSSTPRSSEWFAGRDRDETVDALLAAGVLAAPVWDQMIQDELPQLAERGFTQWLEHPVAGRVGYPGTGVRADTFDNSYRAPAPTVGQHTAEVLTELGLTADEIDALRQSGVV